MYVSVRVVIQEGVIFGTRHAKVGSPSDVYIVKYNNVQARRWGCSRKIATVVYRSDTVTRNTATRGMVGVSSHTRWPGVRANT